MSEGTAALVKRRSFRQRIARTATRRRCSVTAGTRSVEDFAREQRYSAAALAILALVRIRCARRYPTRKAGEAPAFLFLDVSTFTPPAAAPAARLPVRSARLPPASRARPGSAYRA